MLPTHCILILTLFLTVFQLTYARSYIGEKRVSVSPIEYFDILVFTQNWPETFYNECKEKIPSQTCRLPSTEGWTIHGLWPEKFDALGPFFCNGTRRFNESALHPIAHLLHEKWVNFEVGKPHFSFWEDQWEKHGTCSSVLTDLNRQIKYFQKGLDLFEEYDMTHVLAKANILPGQNYAIQKIIDGVNKILGKHAVINCVKNQKTNESYIAEIKICLDKSFNLIDCDQSRNYPTNCDRTMPVIYPGITPSKYTVILI